MYIAWYSARFPSRPTQFTAQEPDYRSSFWGFPHPSIDTELTTVMVSTLYDDVIASTLSRIALATTATGTGNSNNECDDRLSTVTGDALIGLCVLLGCSVCLLSYIYCFNSRTNNKHSDKYSDYESVEVDQNGNEIGNQNQNMLSDSLLESEGKEQKMVV